LAQRKAIVGIDVVMHRQPDLFQVVLALGAAGGFAGLLDSGKKKGDQNSNDRNDDKQLDQREAAIRPERLLVS